ncbi:ABC-three component system protein [Vibrio parahaemolyticus]
MSHPSFDATPSLLGYLYQLRLGLLVALEKSREVSDIDNCTITIETIDDLSVEDGAISTELIQSKHHLSKGNLTDKSPDIWKTLRVWCENISNQMSFLDRLPVLTLLSTETVVEGSLAACLSANKLLRNETDALRLLREIADKGGNKANEEAYKAFSNLDVDQQVRLVSCIYVSSEASNIVDVENDIAKHLRLSVSAENLHAFTSRVEGVWFKWSIDAMVKNGPNSINLAEFIKTLEALSKEYSPTSLPAEYEDISTDEFITSESEKLYIQQLKQLPVTERTLKTAIKNCVKAKRQRSSWHRQGLLLPGELKKYEDKIYEEWEIHFDHVQMTQCDLPLENQGASVYTKCQTNGLKRIRPQFDGDYVARGTYHILADEARIGWHPQYEEIFGFNKGEE